MKLIAEFMGCESTTSSRPNPVRKIEIVTYKIPEHGYNDDGPGTWVDKFWPDEMEYDSNWNWIMPVIDKITSMRINNSGVYYTSSHKRVKLECVNLNDEGIVILIDDYGTPLHSVENRIEIAKTANFNEGNVLASFMAVVEFIKWFKSNELS